MDLKVFTNFPDVSKVCIKIFEEQILAFWEPELPNIMNIIYYIGVGRGGGQGGPGPPII